MVSKIHPIIDLFADKVFRKKTNAVLVLHNWSLFEILLDSYVNKLMVNFFHQVQLNIHNDNRVKWSVFYDIKTIVCHLLLHHTRYYSFYHESVYRDENAKETSYILTGVFGRLLFLYQFSWETE